MPLAWNPPTGKLEKKAVLQTRRKVVREWGREGLGNFNFAGLPCGRDFVVWWATQNSMFLCLLKEKCPKKHDSSGIF